MKGRDKGLSFEIEIARLLSKWAKSKKDIFWRSPGSGSIPINESKGDIISIDPIGDKFLSLVSIECKFYKNLDLLSLVDKSNNKSNAILSFWHQASTSAKDKIPLLIVKRNYGKILLITVTNLLTYIDCPPVITLKIDDDLLGIVPLTDLLDKDFQQIVYQLEKFQNKD